MSAQDVSSDSISDSGSRHTRRREFADAALRIVAREGLPGLSFRSLATESGWSLGAVQKSFATKQELLSAVLDHAQSAVTEDSGRAPASPDLERWLIDLVMSTLPLDDARRAAVVVGIAFSDRAPFDATIAESIRERDAAIHTQLCRLFSWRRAEGELVSRMADAHLATAILALSAGIAGQLIYDPTPETEVMILVTATIDALLGA